MQGKNELEILFCIVLYLEFEFSASLSEGEIYLLESLFHIFPV